MAYQMFDPFSYIQPGPFISKYQDWITFTLLLTFFISIVGIALSKRFQGNRYLRPLVITIGLMLAVGTYFGVYRGWLHITFEGLGLFGAILVLITICFVVFGLVKGFGMQTWHALPLGYTLFYISLWAVSPNIFDTISKRIPIVNGILLILFIISIVKAISGFMHHSKSPDSWSMNLKRSNPAPVDASQIDDEIKSEKIEQKLIKKKDLKLTKSELKDIKQIDNSLKEIQRLLENKTNLTAEDKYKIVQELRRIARTRTDFDKSLATIQKYIQKYKISDNNKSTELQKRYHAATDKEKKAAIQREWNLEKKKLDILSFITHHNDKVAVYLKNFNDRLNVAVSFLQNNNLRSASYQISYQRNDLSKMRTILEQLKTYEKHIIKLSKKEERQLKSERKGN